MRRKGELSAASIDHDWPHQVVLPARLCERDGYNEKYEFCRDLALCSRGHALYHDTQWFHVYCFKEQVDAQKFMERFGGEKFDPAERGRGANWATWKKATRMPRTLFRQVFDGVKNSSPPGDDPSRLA